MFIAFLRQHWLRERGLMLRCTLPNLIESIPLCSKLSVYLYNLSNTTK
jgi:hypothetical protein